MIPFLTKIFSGSAKEITGKIFDGVDKLFTSKEERLKAELEAEKEVNRHMEALADQANKELELILKDKDSARNRENEFVKSTGHIDYLMWFLAISAVIIFGYMVISVITNSVAEGNRELIFHIFGIVEGVLLSIFSYYFGSSAGSRIKDMRSDSKVN